MSISIDICLNLTVCYLCNKSFVEGFASNETVQGLSAVYTSNAVLTNLQVTGALSR